MKDARPQREREGERALAELILSVSLHDKITLDKKFQESKGTRERDRESSKHLGNTQEQTTMTAALFGARIAIIVVVVISRSILALLLLLLRR